jgi:hypothetical protein
VTPPSRSEPSSACIVGCACAHFQCSSACALDNSNCRTTHSRGARCIGMRALRTRARRRADSFLQSLFFQLHLVQLQLAVSGSRHVSLRGHIYTGVGRRVRDQFSRTLARKDPRPQRFLGSRGREGPRKKNFSYPGFFGTKVSRISRSEVRSTLAGDGRFAPRSDRVAVGAVRRRLGHGRLVHLHL